MTDEKLRNLWYMRPSWTLFYLFFFYKYNLKRKNVSILLSIYLSIYVIGIFLIEQKLKSDKYIVKYYIKFQDRKFHLNILFKAKKNRKHFHF